MIKNPLKKLIVGLATLGMFVSLASCGQNKTDYVHGHSVRLKLDYKGHDFMQDGISEVTVKTYIDGDTTHFYLNGDTSKVLKSRYFGIDTPESTGNIQPYGKQASNFTHEKLAKAAENGTIVVSSPFSVSVDGSAGIYDKPEADSTGSRYLSLVWINENVKHAPVESLVLLNLWIVQEGLSWARIGEDEPFYDTFFKAQKQAERLKLKIWSDKDDPLFNYGDYETVTLKEIKDEIINYIEDPNDPRTYVNEYHNHNVRFRGVVAGYSDRILYVQERYIIDKVTGDPVSEDEYDPEHPELYEVEWAGINIFVGTSPLPDPYADVGAYIEVVGNAQDNENFGFQISDTQGKWLFDPDDDESCQLLLSSAENTGEHALKIFEYTAEELNEVISSGNYESLYCRTKITQELVCTDAYVNESGDEMTLYFEGCDFNVYAPFLYRGDPDNLAVDWMHRDNVVGKTFEVSGVLGYHVSSSGKLSYQVIACNEEDLVCKTPKEGTVTDKAYSVSEAVENFPTAIPNVHYYVNGKVSDIDAIDRTAYDSYTSTYEVINVKEALDLIDTYEDGGESKKKYCIKGTIESVTEQFNPTEGKGSYVLKNTIDNKDYTISLYKVGVENGVDGASIGKLSEVIVEAKLKKYVNKSGDVSPEITYGNIVAHYSEYVRNFTLKEGDDLVYFENARVEEDVTVKNLVVGSTLSVIGLPTERDEKLYYDEARVLVAFEHGQPENDPLTIQEAIDKADECKKGKRTEGIYYLTGTIKSIIVEYNAIPTDDQWIGNSSKFTVRPGQDTGRICFVLEDETGEFIIWGAMMKYYAATGSYVDYTKVVVGAKVLVCGKLIKNNDDAETLSTYYNGCQVVSVAE